MKFVAAVLGLAVLAASADAAFDPDAQSILGSGKWGLVEGTGTASDISDARQCNKTSMSFSFSADEIQRITYVNGQPPAGPPDFFSDVKIEKNVTATTLGLFAAKGDATPAASYIFDNLAQTLAHTDAVPGELYAFCTN